MKPELQRCRSCGYQRDSMPSAYPQCCGEHMEAVLGHDIWINRIGTHALLKSGGITATMIQEFRVSSI